jgi:nucleoside-diphosphate-sugar epimerase
VKSLVTGATGFVGRHVTAALDAAGHDGTAMTRRPEQYRGTGAAVWGDIVVHDHRIEELVHHRPMDFPEAAAAALAVRARRLRGSADAGSS